jgi:hypothetical protein
MGYVAPIQKGQSRDSHPSHRNKLFAWSLAHRTRVVQDLSNATRTAFLANRDFTSLFNFA